jgi:outer membrane protein assembly factor BamB
LSADYTFLAMVKNTGALLYAFALLALLGFAASCSGHSESPIPNATLSKQHRHMRAASSTSAYAGTILADSPTAYYRLDDTGTSAVDSSGHSLNGTIGSSITKNAPGLILTDSDAAMSFPGLASAAGVVSFPQATQLQPASAVTLEGWIRFTTTPVLYAFVTGYGSDNTESPYGFYFRSGGLIDAQFALTGGTVDLKAPSALAINTTYYLAETYDGTTARFYVNGVQVASAPASGTLKNYQPGYGFSIGDDAQRSDPAFKGTIDEVAVYAGTALTATRIADHYAVATTRAAPSPSPSPSCSPSPYVDWNTFGDSLQRTGYNPCETTLTRANVSGLTLLWSTTDLGGAITAQPVLATNVTVNAASKNVLYVGAENNAFFAIDADSGAIIWENSALGSSQHTFCGDLPGGQFGVTDTATFDKSHGVVYVADTNDKVHALSMSTGAELWNVNALFDPNTNAIVGSPPNDHVYGAMTYNPANGMLYAYTGSECDFAPWNGRIIAINTATRTVTAAFFPGRTGSGKVGTTYCGGGIWGMGGASIDPVTNDVFVASGNTVISGVHCPGDAMGEEYPYGDSVIQLDPQLNLIAFETANIGGSKQTLDLDFGGTPMLYTPSDCSAAQLSTKNKSGYIYTDGESSGGLTFEQEISIAKNTSGGDFVGVPAFDPKSGLVYVGNPQQVGNFAHGLNAFAQAGGCTGLTLAWKASIGSANATAQDNEAPTVANGVVYFADGMDDQLWAFDDATGAVLWQSGTSIGPPCTTYGSPCGVFAAPTVDRRVYVGSFNHKLYAFGLVGGAHTHGVGASSRHGATKPNQ